MGKENLKELQSRREFFKKAAKGALPILGAIVLTNAPSIVNSAESEYCTCSGSCKGTCSGGCQATCYTECYNACKGTCKGSCQGSCSGGCDVY